MNIYLVKAACGVDWDETKAYVCVAHCCDNCKYYEVDNEEH